jgi:hypothetical protein
MKKLLLVLLAMIFCGGCVAVKYEHSTYGVVDGSLTLLETKTTSYGSACVNIKTGMMIVDVNDEFRLVIVKRDLIADPNSMKAIGEAFGKGVKAFVVP